MGKKSKKKKEQLKESSGDTQKSQAYPWWAKLAVTLALLSWLGLSIVFTMSMSSGVQMVKHATDPVYIAEAVKKIADIEELPAGFKYQMAASVFNANMVTIIHESDGSGFMLGVLPASEKRNESARQLADTMADQGIPSIANELKIEGRNNLEVAGQKLDYVLATAVGKDKRNVGCFIGCAVLKDKRALLVYGVTPAHNKEAEAAFNMEAAKKLFASIKSF